MSGVDFTLTLDDEIAALARLCGFPPSAISQSGWRVGDNQVAQLFMLPDWLTRSAANTAPLYQLISPRGVRARPYVHVDGDLLRLCADTTSAYHVLWMTPARPNEKFAAELHRRPLAGVVAIWINHDRGTFRCLHELAQALRTTELALIHLHGLVGNLKELLDERRNIEFAARIARLGAGRRYEEASRALEFAPLGEEETEKTLGIPADSLFSAIQHGELEKVGESGFGGPGLTTAVMTHDMAAEELGLPREHALHYLERRGIERFTNGLWPAAGVGILAARRRFHSLRTREAYLSLPHAAHQIRNLLDGYPVELRQKLINWLIAEGVMVTYQNHGIQQRYVLLRHLNGILAAIRGCLSQWRSKGIDGRDLLTVGLSAVEAADYLCVDPRQIGVLLEAGIIGAPTRPFSALVQLQFVLLRPSLLRA